MKSQFKKNSGTQKEKNTWALQPWHIHGTLQTHLTSCTQQQFYRTNWNTVGPLYHLTLVNQ